MIKMKKLNNKGFSLVELIIVIAIMAILVGVVGTQVIPYLENSRKAKDIQIISAWNTAAVSAYSTEAGSLNSLTKYQIDVEATGISFGPSGADGLTQLKNTFLALTALDASGYNFSGEMSSKAGKDISKVTLTIDGDTGSVITKTTNTTPAKYQFDDIENK
jgi:prepilin-type N-terminal cleavage/methylation domain-containing protein